MLALTLTAALKSQVIEFYQNYDGDRFVDKMYLAAYDSIRYVPKQDWNAQIEISRTYIDVKGQGHVVLAATTGPDAHEAYLAMQENSITTEYFTEKQGEYKSLPAGTTTEVDMAVPDLSRTYGVMLFTRNRYYPNQYYFVTLAVEPGMWTNWVPIGKGTYTDDLVGPIFGGENLTYEVEVQENLLVPGMYCIKNPYGEAYPLNEPGDWDATQDYYFVINAEDPTAVYIEEQDLGLDWGYGMFKVVSRASYYIARGWSKDEVKAENLFGKLEDGVITFPVNAFMVALANYNDGAWSFYGNQNGAFRLVLPQNSTRTAAPSKPAGQGMPITNRHGKQFKIATVGERIK